MGSKRSQYGGSPQKKTSAGGAQFEHTNVYDPIGWDRFDPRPHPGCSPLEPGCKVRMVEKNISPAMGKMGAFNVVEDERGNRQSVMTKSLKGKNYKYETPEIFRDRKGENPFNS